MVADPVLEIDVVERTDGAWLRLRGELDMGTLGVLRDGFDKAMEIDADEVVVDAGELTWIGVTGVNELVDQAERVRCAGQRVRVVHPSTSLLHLLRLLQLERPLGVVC